MVVRRVGSMTVVRVQFDNLIKPGGRQCVGHDEKMRERMEGMEINLSDQDALALRGDPVKRDEVVMKIGADAMVGVFVGVRRGEPAHEVVLTMLLLHLTHIHDTGAFGEMLECLRYA